jgi:hypothetical protein
VTGTREKKDTNKLTILAFKIILILHNTLLATFIKASGKCQVRPLKESVAEPYKNARVCPKISVKKTNKKEDKNKLTTLAFKTTPMFHNTLLATTKIKFFLGLLPIFGAHQPTHQTQFLWVQTQTLLWGNLYFWEGSQTQMLLRGLLPILGPTGNFCGSGAQNQILLWGHFSVWGVSQTQILLRDFSPFWGPTGAFWSSGAQNLILFRGFYQSLGSRTLI